MPTPYSTNYTSDFEVLLENENEKQVHQKCIELFMIDVYKYLNGLSPEIMNDIFKLRKNTHSLRNFHIFQSQNQKRTKEFGLGSIAYRASQLWENVPEETLNARIGEHTGISSLTKKQVRTKNSSVVRSRSFTILQPFIILWQFSHSNE